MKRTILAILVLVTVGTVVKGQRAKSAVLPTSEAKAVANQCSRESPEDFTDTWEPTAEQIRVMETKLGNISRLRAKCCIEGVGIKRPQDWYMQYVGLVYRGEKVIYINAVGREPPPDFVSRIVNENVVISETRFTWKMRAIVICDGGSAWGVLYDPMTGKFSDLAVNGVG